jgi:hypothetical protein
MKKINLIFLILLIAFSNCASQSKKSSNISKFKYLKMDFFSPGDGIDSKSHDVFVGYLKKNKKILKGQPSSFRWGREGEITYCFDINGFTKKSILKIEKDLNAIKKKSNKIHLEKVNECAKN